MEQIRADLEAKVPAPIEHLGFFMTKGSFSKGPAGATSDLGKMVGGFLRKKKGGDLTGATTGKSVMGLDNHQTALVLAGGTLYAIDSTTSMGGEMTIGEVLGSWPVDELVVDGSRKNKGKAGGYETVQINLDITHPPTGGGGEMEAMTYEGLGDPTLEFYEVITALG